jgi:UDP-2,3-diacylglucosamine pyrophosphatase LpxH
MNPEISHHRTIWISDIHLGLRGARTDLLLDFLKWNECEKLYLVGDIVDAWIKRLDWPQTHNDVVQKILRKVRKGTKVIYLPGNHDDAMRRFVGQSFGGIQIVDDCVHETVDGKRYLVIHGDQFDFIMRHFVWLAWFGMRCYVAMLKLNGLLAIWRRWAGLPYWSLSAYLKQRTKRAVDRIGRFERLLVGEARRRGLDGVICGHVHTAERKVVDGLTYINDGDWVESCTALIEHADGRLELVDWREAVGARIIPLPALRAA